MRALIASFVTCIALAAAPVAAQSCSDLSVTGSGAPGGTLTFAVAGATASSPTLLLVGETAGTTTIQFGMLGSLTLGLATPFVAVPLGFTDATGAVSQSIDIPAGATIPLQTLNAQAVTASFSRTGGMFALNFCTSDVESFQIGS